MALHVARVGGMYRSVLCCTVLYQEMLLPAEVLPALTL
jgi:hypothetical protein